MTGTPTAPYHHSMPGLPAGSPTPIGYPQGYGPQRGAMPSPAPVPAHMQQPMGGHPMPAQSQSGFMPQTPHHHAPQYQPQQYVPSPGQPAVGHHHHMAAPALQPAAYDNRAMAPMPTALAPARAPMAAVPSPVAMQANMVPPHAAAPAGPSSHHSGGGGYNPPQPPQVYTLPDAMDAGIPDDVREQFQRDARGRVLFFTTPPAHRPHAGVSDEHAGLGHSARFLADRKASEAERLRKRKERDEELARAAGARKKATASCEDGENNNEAAATPDQDREAAVVGVLSSFVESMDRMTTELNVAMDGWSAEKAKW